MMEAMCDLYDLLLRIELIIYRIIEIIGLFVIANLYNNIMLLIVYLTGLNI